MARPHFLDTAPCPVIGMIHLRALPGAPGFAGDVRAVEKAAVADLAALEAGGAHAVMVENFHDTPFFPGAVPVETVASMAAIVRTLRERTELPLGVNVLRNDGCAALGVAVACGADFVRVNVLVGARLTDQGLVQGIAHELLRARKRLDAGNVAILADVAVKHSAPLAPYPLDQEVADLVARGGADALIVTGPGTGRATDEDEIAAVREAAPETPVLVGSGVDADSAARLAPLVDALIVGTSLKGPGAHAPVDPALVARLVSAANPKATTVGPRTEP